MKLPFLAVLRFCHILIARFSGRACKRMAWLVGIYVGGLCSGVIAFASPTNSADAINPRREISILWKASGAAGQVDVDRVELETLHVRAGQGTVSGNTFQLSPNQAGRLDLVLSAKQRAPSGGAVSSAPSALPALVTIMVSPRGFTFRADDVSADYPIYLPADQVVITESSDQRSYDEIVTAIQARGGETKLQAIENAPEASFESVAGTSREVKLQTWLGVSRDIRMFRVEPGLDSVQVKYSGFENRLEEMKGQPAMYSFHFGRGWSVRDVITRQLEERELPILRGTHYLVADMNSHGRMLTPAQAAAEKELHEAEMHPAEEVVLYVRAVATNRGKAPQYAFFRTVMPALAPIVSPKLISWDYDAAQGFGVWSSGRVFAVSKLDGAPLPADEHSLLLQPGKSAVMELYLPHNPVSRERATALAQQSFDEKLAEARAFWKAKLAAAAQWELPEARIQQMMRAGLLHLDLVTYGREPDGPLLPAIGIYTAIGSESAPIIQFMDSMGWHDTAARSIEFFLEKQHDDGFMQNFNGYMLETGAVLWTMGEHYRYTRDEAWLRRVHGKVTKAWHYLRAWRQRNLQPELKGNGYGMLDGKTADPEDPYRSFMLNGYAYLGLARTAEMLREIAPDEATECLAEANALKESIRESLAALMVRSPVIPLGNGSWSRTAPPWTLYRGPVMLHTDGGRWFTHWSVTSRDSLLGPLYLVFQEVLSPNETMAREILATHSELMTRDNTALTQPYYSRHPWVHLQRGETKAFLQAWYATLAALADRETYTFDEHVVPVSAHKTHEEAWFLMETRWMLYLEAGDTLSLLKGVPRAYLKPGAKLALKNAASYFGHFSLDVSVAPDGQSVHVVVDCAGERRPSAIKVRLPQPLGQRAVSVEGGEYLPDEETVWVKDFSGHAEITVRYP